MQPAPHDPYQPPTAELDARQAEGEYLATRARRLAAAILDAAILSLFNVPAMMAAGVWEQALRGEPMEPSVQAAFTAGSFVAWLALNGFTLARRGQSLGKLALGIAIVGTDDAPLSLWRIALLRVLPLQLVALIPMVGQAIALLDVLFIFGKERRCLHDRIAGTRVVVYGHPRSPFSRPRGADDR